MKKPHRLVSSGALTNCLKLTRDTVKSRCQAASDHHKLSFQQSQFVTDTLCINRKHKSFLFAAALSQLSSQSGLVLSSQQNSSRCVCVGVHHCSLLVSGGSSGSSGGVVGNLNVQSSSVFCRFKNASSTNLFDSQSISSTSLFNCNSASVDRFTQIQSVVPNVTLNISGLFAAINRACKGIISMIPSKITLATFSKANNCGCTSYHFSHINLQKLPQNCGEVIGLCAATNSNTTEECTTISHH